MTNAPGARGRGQSEDAGGRAEAEPLFPSEGTFSTVVPLSQVRDGPVSEGDSAVVSAAAPEEEEATLVPARVSPATRARHAPAARRVEGARRVGRRWLAPMAAALLSISAGVVAGAYMVWTRQTRQARPPVTQAADAAALSQPAPEAAPTKPAQVASPDAAEASAPSAEVVKVERSESAETSAEVGKPEPASRREAEAERRASETERRTSEAEPRASRRTRANAETIEAAPAPRPARGAAAPRRQPAPARPKPNATATAGRALPVSSPPPSAKSRTVIQWP